MVGVRTSLSAYLSVQLSVYISIYLHSFLCISIALYPRPGHFWWLLSGWTLSFRFRFLLNLFTPAMLYFSVCVSLCAASCCTVVEDKNLLLGRFTSCCGRILTSCCGEDWQAAVREEVHAAVREERQAAVGEERQAVVGEERQAAAGEERQAAVW